MSGLFGTNNGGTNAAPTGNLVFNMNDVNENQAGGFSAMPKGDYDCIVDECEFTYSQNSGAPMLVFKYKVVDNDEFPNRTLFHHCVLNKEFGVAMVKKVLLSTGVQFDGANFDPESFADQGDIVGLPIKVNVGIQTYNGEKRNNVKTVKAASTGGFMQG